METSIHSVNKITIGKIRENKTEEQRKFAFREITVQTSDGEILVISMYADTPIELSI